MLGHSAPPVAMWDENLVTGEQLAICPIRLLLDASEEDRRDAYAFTYEDFPLFKRGHLLVEGGIAAQPARWLEAMRYLDTLDRLKEVAFKRALEQDNDA